MLLLRYLKLSLLIHRGFDYKKILFVGTAYEPLIYTPDNPSSLWNLYPPTEENPCWSNMEIILEWNLLPSYTGLELVETRGKMHECTFKSFWRVKNYFALIFLLTIAQLERRNSKGRSEYTF